MNLNFNHFESPSNPIFPLDDDFDKKITTYFDNPVSPDLGLVKKRQHPLNISPECPDKEFQTTQFKCTSSLFEGSTATNLGKENTPKVEENRVKLPDFNGFIEGKDEKRFVCPEINCGIAFKFNCELKRHMNSHLKLEKFQCNQCDKIFTRKDNLLSHMKTHDKKEFEFNCLICKEGFNKKWSLQNHLKKHEDTTSVLCEFPGCQKKIANNQKDIKKHYMFFHAIEPPLPNNDKFKNCEEINNLNSGKSELSKKTKAEERLKDQRNPNEKDFGDELRKKMKTDGILLETIFNFESKYG
jgi:hypothetical protein